MKTQLPNKMNRKVIADYFPFPEHNRGMNTFLSLAFLCSRTTDPHPPYSNPAVFYATISRNMLRFNRITFHSVNLLVTLNRRFCPFIGQKQPFFVKKGRFLASCEYFASALLTFPNSGTHGPNLANDNSGRPSLPTRARTAISCAGSPWPSGGERRGLYRRWCWSAECSWGRLRRSFARSRTPGCRRRRPGRGVAPL